MRTPLGTTIAPHLILSLKPEGPVNTKELYSVKGRSEGKLSPGRPALKPGS